MKSDAFLLSVLIAGFGLGLAGPAPAHHAFTAQYDSNMPVTLTGIVAKVEWMNPHTYFFINVTDEETGQITYWACEMGSPVSLMRRGWTRNSMEIGDVVTVDGSLAKDGSALMNARSVVLAETGQRLFAGSSEDQGQ